MALGTLGTFMSVYALAVSCSMYYRVNSHIVSINYVLQDSVKHEKKTPQESNFDFQIWIYYTFKVNKGIFFKDKK